MTISIGGFLNSSHPMPLVRAIIRNGVKNLTVVGAASAGLETDLLIGAGCVKTVIAPMISGESLAPIGPSFRTRRSATRSRWSSSTSTCTTRACAPPRR